MTAPLSRYDVVPSPDTVGADVEGRDPIVQISLMVAIGAMCAP